MCFLSQEPTTPTAPTAPTAPAFAANEAIAEEVLLPAQAPAQDIEFRLEDQMRELSVSDAVTRYELNKRYHMLMHVTEWLENGHSSVICDFHITSQHKDYFRATITPSGHTFLLQTRVHPTLLVYSRRP